MVNRQQECERERHTHTEPYRQREKLTGKYLIDGDRQIYGQPNKQVGAQTKREGEKERDSQRNKQLVGGQFNRKTDIQTES